MIYRVVFTGALGFAALCGAVTAQAQVAAEEAVILSGSAGQGKAARSLGGAIRGSLNRASDAVAAANRGSVRVEGNRQRRSSGGRQAKVQGVVPRGVDPLQGTDAPAYALESGATIKVTGGFTPSATTRCTVNCEARDGAVETGLPR